MAVAYIIVESKISDPEQFKQYLAASPGVAKAFGGEFLVRGGRIDVLEGDWQPTRMTVLRYPDMATARAMYDSEAYTAVRALRAGATEMFNMVLVEGVDAPVG
ncbi:MAG: DUF1330 domain-containing protein [Actinobacteria bacterium]|nr:DUF1330 domain-containing protein [Actinomycetota bacterium]